MSWTFLDASAHMATAVTAGDVRMSSGAKEVFAIGSANTQCQDMEDLNSCAGWQQRDLHVI